MAVFTPVTDDEARGFLKGYEIGDLVSLEGVAEGVENSNFRLETTQGVYALTLFEKRVDPSALPYYLGLMEHLSAHGVVAPAPARDDHGRLVGLLNSRAAAIVEWLPGRWLREPTLTELDIAGQALGKLHLASAGFPMQRKNNLSVSGWRDLIERCDWRAKDESRRMLDILIAETDWLAPRWPTGLPQGAIHADFFPDNVLFLDGQVSGIIDYYFACTDALAYDLAIALSAWGFDINGNEIPGAIDAFSKGYEKVRPLSNAERDAFLVLCRGAAVRFSLTRLHDQLFHDPSWKVTPKDPTAYFNRLRFFQAAAEQRPAANG
jgi:homoserine kinase type II